MFQDLYLIYIYNIYFITYYIKNKKNIFKKAYSFHFLQINSEK